MSQKMKIALLFSGSASALRYLHEDDSSYGVNYEIVLAISNKKKTKGENFCKANHIAFAELNTKSFCVERNHEGKIKEMPKEIREEYFDHVLELINLEKPDLIMLSGFMLEITKPLLGYCDIVNVHPADLRVKSADGKPLYVGDDAVTLALSAGETSTCSTIHYVTEEVDCGPIIFVSEPLAVREGDTPQRHQEKMKYACDGPAYKRALEILYEDFSKKNS